MSVEELPSRHRYPPPGRLTFNTDTNTTTLQKPKWDKSNALNGRPTFRFRENLRDDKKYVTTWNFGGLTNEVMVWMNLIHLGLRSDRIPILFPVIGLEWQVGVGPESLSAGSFFDLPRLSEAIGLPVVDWQDVKRGRYNRPWGQPDWIPHDDDEVLGCWSIVQTFDESKKPLDREGGPLYVHIDAHYTAVPPTVKLAGTDDGWHTSFESLSHLLSPAGRSQALSLQPPLPTYDGRPLPPTIRQPKPDNQLACFDCLYWVWEEVNWEWERTRSPTWDAVGTHLHFTKEADDIATYYLQKVFGLQLDEDVPPFIAIHARRADFKNLCKNPDDPKSCHTRLSEYARHARELANELVQIHGSDSPLAQVNEVIVLSDEADPEWWAEVESMGWRQTRPYEEEIARDYGKRWPGIVDSIILSRGAAFIGTSQSTMSIIAGKRVKDWNKGPVRLEANFPCSSDQNPEHFTPLQKNQYLSPVKPMTEIKPSQKDILSRVISTLVDGICEANDCDLRFSGIEWADAVPVGCLGTFRDELKAVQAQLNQKLDKIIGLIAHRWNLVTPSIHKLPLEVLVMIFGEFEPSAPNPGVNTSLFDLLLVCRTWYDAIIESPRLWGYVDESMSQKIARLVIDRSQLHPISVNWHSYRIPQWPKEFNFVGFLDLTLENLARVRSVDISLPQSDCAKLRELLEGVTPALETLRVRIQPNDSEEDQDISSNSFTLSEGSHLKHLSFDGVMTPWDHPRLSELITLALTGSSVPKSPKQLLQILSRLLQLEELDIRYVRDSAGEARASGPILLPYLKKLVLLYVAPIYNAIILASIHTPSCSHIVVQDWAVDEDNIVAVEALDDVIWRPGNHQTASVLRGANSKSERRTLRVEKLVRCIRVQGPMSTHGYRDPDLRFGRLDIPRFMTQLATAISQLPSPPGVELEDALFKKGRIPTDLLPWSEVLESLMIKGQDACRSVLQQLSQRHVIPGTGEVDWVCRKLSKITLEYWWGEEEDAATDGKALLSLVRQRWSGEDGFAGTVLPSVFEVYCEEANFPNLWSLKDEITQILPSFRLIAIGV